MLSRLNSSITFSWVQESLNFILRVGFALIVGVTVNGCSTQNKLSVFHQNLPQSVDQEFTPDQLNEDIRFMVNTLENVHIDLYASVSPDTISMYRKNIEMSLTKPHSRIEFYKLIAPLVSRFEDGHTGVTIPYDEFNQFQKNGGLIFPFTIRYDDVRGLIIETSYTKNGNPVSGSRIIEINGISADSIFVEMRNGMSGERLKFREHAVVNNFRALLWLHNIHAPYVIKYQSETSDVHQNITVEGITRDEILRIDGLAEHASTNQALYTYELLDDKIAYIDFRSMRDSQQFASFLEKTFTDIHHQQPIGLIIDLRHNSGGDSRLGKQLLGYITDKTYSMSGGKSWKMSKIYRQYIRNHISPYIRWITYPPAIYMVRLFRPEAKIFTIKNGGIATLHFKPTKPEPNSLRYSGKVSFLIGNGTFSSAMMLANTVEDYEIATLVGEETGGIPNHFGEVYSFYLPNSGLRMYVSTAKFIRANGDPNNPNGVLPDIEVSPHQLTTHPESDSVLEVAKNWILSNTDIHRN